LVTDIISEKWGKKEAQKAVWSGFYANIILAVSVFIAISWSSSEFAAEAGNVFNSALGMTPRIVAASMIAYLISQTHDIKAFDFGRKKPKEKNYGSETMHLHLSASSLIQ